jgi:hypothetical protein
MRRIVGYATTRRAWNGYICGATLVDEIEASRALQFDVTNDCSTARESPPPRVICRRAQHDEKPRRVRLRVRT